MKKVIFFAYDLNIGGIEKSLVNLLNELVNYYEVTLVLEKNEGPLKRNLSNKVKIIEHKISESKITILRKGINFTKRVLFTLKYKNKYDLITLNVRNTWALHNRRRNAKENDRICKRKWLKYTYAFLWK